MEGTVQIFEAESGKAAVDTPLGFAVLEVSHGLVAEGDCLAWTPDTPLGRHEVMNRSTGRTCQVYFLNHRVPSTLLKANF